MLEPTWHLIEGGGSVFGNATRRDLETLRIPWHENACERRAIAHILGTMDDKIELNRRVSETLEAMARALFKAWFVDFLPVRAKMAAKANDPSLLLPQAEPGTWYVYAIECNDGSLYIGQTEDLRQRWLQHIGGKGARWTMQHPPVRVPYWEKQPSREAAVEREKWLKTGYGRKWLKQEIAARTQTGEPVRAKMEGRLPASAGQAGWQRGQSLPGLPAHLYDLFPDRLVDSELGEIPEGWEVGTLGDLSEKPQYGYTASAKEEPVGPKFLRITDINKLPWIDWTTVPYCEIEPEDFEQYRLHSGDVLIARMADPGHGVVIEEQVEAVFASYLIRFRLKDQAHIRYIQYWLRSDGYWELVTSRHAGTTRASLNAQVLSSFQLIIPPKPIASAFSETVNALRHKVVAAVHESRTLAALRDALLPKLIRGEIRVKDAERFLKERGL
jgi:type I restriction enzyme S subunit